MGSSVANNLLASLDGEVVRILPETAHEVPVILLFTNRGRTTMLGDLRANGMSVPDIVVRLGTRVTERQPSCIGFRIFLRSDDPRAQSSRSIEGFYHLISCKFDPRGGAVTYSQATAKDKEELLSVRPSPVTLSRDLVSGNDEEVIRMDFNIKDTNSLMMSHHGPGLEVPRGRIKDIDKLLPYLAYAEPLSLFFIADSLLIRRLKTTLEHGCVGAAVASWKTALPDNVITPWPSNFQTQMVAGSTDILNILYNTSGEKILQDGPGTSARTRPEAQQFQKFVQKFYPNLQRESGTKTYPLMLNVCLYGQCTELPFGGSMLNRVNTYAAINALHGLLAAGLSPGRIGIITLYPTQVEAYQDALILCHNTAPQRGYDQIQVGLLENWIQKTVGIAIVDLVRTPNATGNLGHLSQTNRLKLLLSRHENGLIVVGDRTCTFTPQGFITSAKLEKVLQWFVDHERLVQISHSGLPLSMLPSTATRPCLDGRTHSQSSTVSDLSTNIQAARQRKYVGIPGLEHFSSEKITPPKINTSTSELEEDCNQQATKFTPSKKQESQVEKTSNFDHKIALEDDVLHVSTFCNKVPEISNASNQGSKVGKRLINEGQQESKETSALIGSIPLGKNPNPLGVSSTKVEARSPISSPTASGANNALEGHARHLRQQSKVSTKENTIQKSSLVAQTTTSDYPESIKLYHSKTGSAPQTSFQKTQRKVGAPSSIVPKEDTKPWAPAEATVPKTREAQESASIAPKRTARTEIPILKSESLERKTKEQEGQQGNSQTLLQQVAGRSPAQAPSTLASKGQSIVQSIAAPNGAQSPSSSLLLDQLLRSISTQASQVPAVPSTVIANNVEVDADFKSRYQAKYRSIRSLYAALDPGMPRKKQEEDHLFRCLAEAFMDENETVFDSAYVDLLGIAAGLRTLVLKRDGSCSNSD